MVESEISLCSSQCVEILEDKRAAVLERQHHKNHSNWSITHGQQWLLKFCAVTPPTALRLKLLLLCFPQIQSIRKRSAFEQHLLYLTAAARLFSSDPLHLPSLSTPPLPPPRPPPIHPLLSRLLTLPRVTPGWRINKSGELGSCVLCLVVCVFSADLSLTPGPGALRL